MTTRQAVLDRARSQLGHTEHPRGSNRTDYGVRFGLNGAPWCSIFVWDCFYQAGSDLRALVTPSYASAEAARQGFGHLHLLAAWGAAEPGDVVFYHFPHEHSGANHTGIVEQRTPTGVVAIEGNTSAGSNTNGGAVMRRTRAHQLIIGVGRFRFSVAPVHPPDPKPATPTPTPAANAAWIALIALVQLAKSKTLQVGDSGPAVEIMQKGMQNHGLKIVADGQFGRATRDALRFFQLTAHLVPDGVCGPSTWQALLP